MKELRTFMYNMPQTLRLFRDQGTTVISGCINNNQKALLLHTVHVVRWTLTQGKANRQSQISAIAHICRQY